MAWRRRQVLVVVRGSSRQRWNRKAHEPAAAICRVIFFLRNTGAVKNKILEDRRPMARCAIARMLRAVRGSGSAAKEYLQARQFRRSEYEWLRVILERLIRSGDERGIAQAVDQAQQPLSVCCDGLPPAGRLRQAIGGQERVVG